MTASGVEIDVEPAEPMLDEELRVAVRGLEPGTTVDVHVEMAWEGARWESEATFEAEDGTVDLAADAPVSGPYDGVDPMALFQYVERVADQETDPWVAETVLSVHRDGDVLARRTVRRRTKADDVAVREVDHEWLVGDFYEPTGSGEAPGVVVLGGSEGGVPSRSSEVVTAPLLASHGYAVLDLGYFGCEGLPDGLQEVPVEYFATALWWLSTRSGVREDGFGVVGFSRGAEIALFLASYVDEIRSVVSYSGSGVLFQGIPDGFESPGAPLTYEDDPVDYVRNRMSPRLVARLVGKFVRGAPVSLRPLYDRGVRGADPETLADAEIPVEQVDGPILLLSGEADPVWDATALSERAVDRLDEADYGPPYEHRSYEGAGHAIQPPYTPTTRRTGPNFLPRVPLDVGDTPDGYARADVDAWQAVLEYLPPTGEARTDDAARVE